MHAADRRRLSESLPDASSIYMGIVSQASSSLLKQHVSHGGLEQMQGSVQRAPMGASGAPHSSLEPGSPTLLSGEVRLMAQQG